MRRPAGVGLHWHAARLRDWLRRRLAWHIAAALAAVVVVQLCIIVELLRYIALSA